jgi:hypothetical protein
MPLGILLALPVVSTAAVAALAKPLLGVATLLGLVWTAAVLYFDLGRT